MVKSGAAPVAVEDTRAVGLEDVLVSLDGDGKRLKGQSSLHLVDVIGGDKGVAGNFDRGSLALVICAGGNAACARDIGVGRLKLGLVGLVVLECLVLPATVAGVVGSGAGDELLLGEAQKFTRFDLVSTLEGTSSRE